MCGDSASTADVTALMDGKTGKLCATDPPYLVSYDPKNHPSKGFSDGKNKDWKGRYADKPKSEALGTFYEAFLRQAMAVCEDNAAIYVWHASQRQVEVEQAMRNWKSQEITIHRLKSSLNTVQPIVRHRGRPALCEMSALRVWLKERRLSNDPSEFLFVSRKGGALGQRQVNRLFAEYCEIASKARIARNEAPIAKSVHHVHCLKHSRGTSLAERGVNPYRIKLILGHKSMASTERYLHGSQKQAWAEAQRLSMEII
jgi:Phage integrase family